MGQIDVSPKHTANRCHRGRHTAAATAQAIRGRGAASPRRGESDTPHGSRLGDTAPAGERPAHAPRADTRCTQATASRRRPHPASESASREPVRRNEKREGLSLPAKSRIGAAPIAVARHEELPALVTSKLSRLDATVLPTKPNIPYAAGGSDEKENGGNDRIEPAQEASTALAA